MMMLEALAQQQQAEPGGPRGDDDDAARRRARQQRYKGIELEGRRREMDGWMDSKGGMREKKKFLFRGEGVRKISLSVNEIRVGVCALVVGGWGQ
jgi:hypothetical protein